MATKALTAQQEEERALATLYQDDAGDGFQDTSKDDYAAPFVVILQTNSPQVDKHDAGYVEGAEPGKYLDVATGEVLDGFDFVPVVYHRAMVEWRDREAGGGFVAQHPVGYEREFERDDRGRWRTGPDTGLVDTRYYFGLRLLPDGGATPAVISFSSTQLKKSRTLMTQLRAFTFKEGSAKGQPLPLLSHLLRFGAPVRQENDKGRWFGFDVKRVGPVTDEGLVKLARDFRPTFAENAENVRPADADQAPAAGEAGEGPPF